MAVMAVAAGAMAVSGLVQLYNAEKARGASKKRLKEIERLYNDLVPPNYDLTIIDPPSAHVEKLEMPEFSAPQSAPNWNLEKLTPKQLEQVGEFIPNVAPLIIEENPTLLKKTKEMGEASKAQQTALKRFMEIGEDGYDPELQQRVQDARRRSQSEAQSRSDSIMQDFERRGMGGSGMELAAKIGASAEAMDRNAQMGLQAETDAYRNQLNALAQGAQLGGQLFNQEMGMQARNADIINAFNQRMSKRHQDWEMMRADMMNQADIRNLNEAQRIADYNTMSGNEADRAHQARMDEITRYNAAFDTRERDRRDANQKWRYGMERDERNYAHDRDVQNRQWQQSNIDRQNRLKSQRYGDQLSKLQGKSGLASQYNTLGMGAARDQNQAIQGLANLGATYAMSRQDKPPRRQDKYSYNYEQGDKYYG